MHSTAVTIVFFGKCVTGSIPIPTGKYFVA